MGKHRRKMAIYKTRRKDSEEINPTNTLILRFLTSRTLRK